MPAPRLQLQFWDRSFAPVTVTGGLVCSVERYSHAAMGGPKEAQLGAIGSPEACWQTVEWLRYGVDVLDDRGEPVWWGYIAEVAIAVGVFEFGVSLDSMANRVAVAYSDTSSGSASRGTTLWAQDDESLGTYGFKEALLSLGDASFDQADAFRDAALQIGKWPVPTIGLSTSSDLKVTITCRGWWQTLDWRYYEASGDGAIYDYVIADGETVAQIIPANGDLVVAQTFVSGSEGWTVSDVQLRLQKIGSPTFGVTLTIYQDSGGAPGTFLGAQTVGTAASTMEWTTFSFIGQNVVLSSGVTYWLVVTLTGAGVAGTSYGVGVSFAAGAFTGSGYRRNSGVWSAMSWDMFYRVNGLRTTTAIAKRVIDTVGQFLGDVVIVQDSGIYGLVEADGDSTALAFVEDLLRQGTTSSLRVLARVEQNRDVTLEPEPASYVTSYWIDGRGNLYTPYGVPIQKWACPVGVWGRVKDMIPATAEFSVIADPSRVFIEEMEYDATTDRLTLTPRGQATVWDLTNIA